MPTLMSSTHTAQKVPENATSRAIPNPLQDPGAKTFDLQTPSVRAVDLKWILLLVGLSVGVLLFFFPSQTQLTTLFQRSAASQNSVVFLEHWVKENPNDITARNTLAQKYLDAFDPEKAIAALDLVTQHSPSAHPQQKAYWSALTLLHRAYDQLRAAGQTPKDPLRGIHRNNVQNPELPWALRLTLAQAAFAHQAPEQGQWLLYPDNIMTKTRSTSELREAILLLQRYNHPNQAITLTLYAFRITPDTALWETVLDTFLQSGQHDAARFFYAATPDTLRQTPRIQRRRVVDIARLNPEQLTPQMIQQWLSESPDTQHIQSALQSILHAGQLAQAERICEYWVKQEPNNTEAIQLLHDMQRWQNRVQPALQLSETLLTLKPQQSTLNTALEEAWALSDYEALARFYQHALKHQWLTASMLPQTLFVLDRAFTAEQKLSVLEALSTLFPGSTQVRNAYFEQLIVRGNLPRLQKIWSTLNHYQRQLPLTLRTRIANVAYHNGQIDWALTFLTQDLVWQNITDQKYLQTTQTIAQQLGATHIVENAAYQHYTLTGEVKIYANAVASVYQNDTLDGRFFIERYQRTADPAVLVVAAHQARLAHDDALLTEILQQAKIDNAIDRAPSLWLYAAELLSRQRNPQAASDALAKAVAFLPDDPETQYQQFSHALSLNLTDEITRLYDRHQQDPTRVPTILYAAMAEAADRLNRVEEGIYWYQRALREMRQSGTSAPSWPLYRLATLYDRAGLTDKSLDVKHYLLDNINPADAEALADLDILLLDAYVGRQFTTRHLQNHLLAKEDPALQNRAYVQLVDRLLQNYDYYAAMQWQELGQKNNLQLEPWQSITLANAQTRPPANTRLSDAITPNNPSAYYQTLLLAGKHHEAWQYARSRLDSTPRQSQTTKEATTGAEKPPHSHTPLPQAATPAITNDLEDLRALYLNHYVEKAPLWSTHWRFSLDPKAEEPGETLSVYWQFPNAFGAWYLDLATSKAPLYSEFYAQNTGRQSHKLTLGQRWLQPQHTLETDLLWQDTLEESFLGTAIRYFGNTTFWNSTSAWQWAGYWRAPMAYNEAVDFLTHRTGISLSVTNVHGDLLAFVINGRVDHLSTIFGDSLGRVNTWYNELNSDLLSGDHLLQPYVSWQQQRFTTSSDTQRIGASQFIQEPLFINDLFLTTFEHSKLGFRWGLLGQHLFSHPIEHLLDASIGYESQTGRTGLTLTDAWRWRVGSRHFLELSYGFSALSPQSLQNSQSSQTRWFEVGFKQLLK